MMKNSFDFPPKLIPQGFDFNLFSNVSSSIEHGDKFAERYSFARGEFWDCFHLMDLKRRGDSDAYLTLSLLPSLSRLLCLSCWNLYNPYSHH